MVGYISIKRFSLSSLLQRLGNMKNIEIYNYYEMVIKGGLGAIMKENIVGTVFDGIKNIKEVIKTATL